MLTQILEQLGTGDGMPEEAIRAATENRVLVPAILIFLARHSRPARAISRWQHGHPA